MDDQFTLTAVVEKRTDHKATITVAGQSISWPVEALPPEVQQGDEVSVRLLTKDAIETERHEYARAVLGEILGGAQ